VVATAQSGHADEQQAMQFHRQDRHEEALDRMEQAIVAFRQLYPPTKHPDGNLLFAGLTVYRHPELIPDLAGERGAPRQTDAVAVKPMAALPARAERADTKLWAAFTLSGVGR